MKVLVTAGPTRESIDLIRFLSNRSTGKMGFALADQAVQRGHVVKLIAGPVSLDTPRGVDRQDVETTKEMLEAVRFAVPWCDALIMAAAVSDWRPAAIHPGKMKKRNAVLDILMEIAPLKGGRLFVGFAAEAENIEVEARRKLREKGLDLIVANDVTESDAAFEAETNRVTLFDGKGEVKKFPLASKQDVASCLMQCIEERLYAL